jgi:hypothetical protein
MESVLVSLALLACPVGMGVMMWFMAKGQRNKTQPLAGHPRSLEQLREEQRRLDEEIRRIETSDRVTRSS